MLDCHRQNLDFIPAGIYCSYCWWQQRHPAQTVHMQQRSFILHVDMSEPFVTSVCTTVRSHCVMHRMTWYTWRCTGVRPRCSRWFTHVTEMECARHPHTCTHRNVPNCKWKWNYNLQYWITANTINSVLPSMAWRPAVGIGKWRVCMQQTPQLRGGSQRIVSA